MTDLLRYVVILATAVSLTAPAAAAAPEREPTPTLADAVWPARLVCESEWPHPAWSWGWANYGSGVIEVRGAGCDLLNRAGAGLPVDPVALVDWSRLVAHELSHALEGVVDESQAECAGVRGAARILDRLGVPDARALVRRYVVPYYPLPAGCEVGS
jgi:hypothetical protein